MTTQITILPSLLAGDFGALRDAAQKAETAGADGLHLDIMDGRFVPNLSMGPDVVRMVRDSTALYRSVHLMCVRPDFVAPAFVEAGADLVLIHVESKADTTATLRQIRAHGAKAGITINPETPAESVFDLIDARLIDEILCMSVHPGFGGQKFIPNVHPKITALRNRIEQAGAGCDISVDGGINAQTAVSAAAAGANVLIAGTFLFKAPDMQKELANLRAAAARACAERA